MFPYVIIFYCFCGGPLVVEAPGQLPSLPPSHPTLLALLKKKASKGWLYRAACDVCKYYLRLVA